MPDTYADHLRAGERAGMRYALGAPRGAPRGLAGAHLASRPGSSLEFMEHRAYQPGDDLRHIDWAAYARSDRLTVKVYRHEVNPHVDLLVDGSRSMALDGTAKRAATVGLAALLATAAANSRFAHRVWLSAETWSPLENGTAPPASWGPMPLDAAADPGEAYFALPPRLAPRGMRFLISDLLWPSDPAALLARLSDAATTVTVVQLLAEEDVRPPEQGNLRLMDCETGGTQEVFIDATASARYRDRLTRHQQHWHRAARQVGAVLITLVAERFLRDWDLDPLMAAGVLKANPT